MNPVKGSSTYTYQLFTIAFLMFCGCNSSSTSPSNWDLVQGEGVTSVSLLQDKGDYFLLGGDIVLNKNDVEHSRIITALKESDAGMYKTGIRMMPIALWPEGNVPYTLQGFSDNEAKVVRSAMDSLQQVCKVSFRQVSANGSYIYKISKINNPAIGGLSTLGYSSTSYCDLSQVLWGTCVHEFMHGLGIHHEHQRPDRDTYITVNLLNVSSTYHSQFKVIPLTITYYTGQTPLEYGRTLSPYDYLSIMHYPSTAFSSNGKLTIVPKQSGVAIGNRYFLSQYDKISLSGMYGLSNWVYVNKLPAVTITVPTANAVYKVGDTVTINATPNDTDGAIKSVSFYLNEQLMGTVSSAPYVYKKVFTAAGTYQIGARATDMANGVSSMALVAVSIKTDMPPTISLTSPKATIVCPINGSLTISAKAADIDGKIQSVKFYYDDQLVCTDLTSPYSYALKNIAIGTHHVKAVATDLKNGTAQTPPVTIVARNKLPTIKLTSPVQGSVCPLGAFTLKATVHDSDGTIASVKFYKNGQLTGTDLTSPFSCIVQNTTSGSCSFYAVVTDNNNAAVSSAVANVTVRNKLPTIKMSYPVNGAAYPSGALTIKTTVNDSDGTIALVKFYKNGVLAGSVVKSPHNFTVQNTSAGSYSFYAVVTDNNGASVSGATANVTVR